MSNLIPTRESNGKFRRLRFTYNDDLAFLKEFLAYNPLQNRDGWEIISKHLELITGKKFSIRTLKQHLQLLIEMWLKKDEIDKIRSGIEEPLSEKDTLLQEISTLCSKHDLKQKRPRSISKEQQLCELGKKARDKYTSIFIDFEAKETDETENEPQHNPSSQLVNNPVFGLEEHNYGQSQEIPFNEEITVYNDSDIIIDNETMIALGEIKKYQGTTPILDEQSGKHTLPVQNTPTSENNILRPTRKRLNKRDPIRKNALSYLSNKSERENQIKKKELELEDRKLSIEERRLALEEKKLAMEEKRLEIDYKERMQRIEIEKEKSQIELCEKKITAQLLQSQQKLIDTIIQKDNK